ncbi:unnamed protein product [Paramecium octaurelia]|uniref:Uncharacterized protein n=1 Tax=Paramecium octaurelia TaxID=43137 RepID=A0A8S1WG77_PAROT|nr:unnamed protein product [Paramecium octaurelia]
MSEQLNFWSQRPKILKNKLRKIKTVYNSSSRCNYIQIEVCQNCQEHVWCIHNDEEKYIKLFFDFQQSMIESSIQTVFTLSIKESDLVQDLSILDIKTYSFIQEENIINSAPLLLVERLKKFLDGFNNKRDVIKMSTKKKLSINERSKKDEQKQLIIVQQYLIRQIISLLMLVGIS